MEKQAEIRLGTSAFTAAGWAGSFYPVGLKPADYLSFYAQRFNTVEVDSTFYRIPSLSTVRGWHAKTPAGFIFAAKIPQTITHEKVLVDCDAELKKFLAVMDGLAGCGKIDLGGCFLPLRTDFGILSEFYCDASVSLRA